MQFIYNIIHQLCLKIIPKFHKIIIKMKRQVKHLETLKILRIEFCKDYFGLFASVIQALA